MKKKNLKTKDQAIASIPLPQHRPPKKKKMSPFYSTLSKDEYCPFPVRFLSIVLESFIQIWMR